MALSYGTITLSNIQDGGKWYSGTAITGTSTTATVFSGSGISSAVVGDMYLNTSTFNTYRCTVPGAAAVAKWVYVNNIKGGTGGVGKGVSSLVTEYYLSTSNTGQAGGSWGTTVPTYVSGRYYWRRDKITWTDNSTTYTTAVLDNALTTANSTAASASSTASAANTTAGQAKSTADSANYREQRIYITKTSATTVAKNETWVTSVQDSQNAWTTKRPTYSPTYPVLYTAIQRQIMTQSSGTACTCTTPIIDDTLTVLDGGHIIANSIVAEKIAAGAITTAKLATDAIKSTNYQASQNASSPYSAAGTFLNLANGNLQTRNFAIDNTNGEAYINGEIIATSGRIGITGAPSYWEIGFMVDYNATQSAAIIGHGTSYIQTGDLQLSNGRLNTQKYNSQNQITYLYNDSTYWDYGVQAPVLDTTTTDFVSGIDDNFIYIRKHASTIPADKTDWIYLYRIAKNGDVYSSANLYFDGGIDSIKVKNSQGQTVGLSSIVATKDSVGSDYLPLSGGTITGNLTVNGSLTGIASQATKLATTRTLTTNLASTTGGSFDGSGNVSIGVTGTLGVGNGGTGKTSWTQYGIVYASATNALSQMAVGTSGQVLTSGGNAAPSWTNQSSLAAGTATKWASAQKVYVTLGTASTTTTIQGGSSTAQTIGVDGTLAVGHGGTGATTFTSGAALIGNGTGAIQTRSIRNNTTAGALGWTSSSTDITLTTTNTLAYWNGAYQNTTSNLEYVKLGKLGTVVTHNIDEFITTSGGIIDGSLSVTDLTAGNLVVNGAGRFTNGLYGDLTGTATSVSNSLKIQLNGGTTEGTNQFTFNGSAAKTVNITKSGIGLGSVENTALSTWAGSSNLTTTKVGTLAAAAAKAVDTSIAASSTSANLPTSAAVAAFVEGKGYVTSSGVTSVRVQATSPVVSSVNTAQSSSLNTTISLADAYGDTKNPYGTKTANYVLAGPASGNAAVPAFRALVAADIPTLAASKVGLGNVTNNKQVKGLASGTTANNIVVWGSDGYTVADGGIAKGSIATKVTLAGTDYSASSNAITITQANLQSAVQSTSLLLMTSAERSKLSSIQVSEGGTIDFSGVTASAPLTATVATDKKVNITHNASGVTAGTYRSVTVNTYGHVTGGTNPTTLSGYGITDAKIASGVITLGSNTITPLTADSSLNAAKLTGTASVSTTGNATTATKFSSNREIKLTGDVTGSASTNGESGWSITTTVADNSHLHVPSNIIARDDNIAGGLDPITASKIGSAASNKSFGLPAAAITIEYSTDGGSTWIDYGTTDASKRDLFMETRSSSFVLGKSAAKSVNNQLRVTIEPTDRYTSFHGFYCWMSTGGNTCTLDLERSTIGNKNTFSTVFTGKPLAGWSGNNIIYFNQGTFGGGSTQTGNNYKYRMIFKQIALREDNTSNASVSDIRFIGDNVWTSPNIMVTKNHMYNWDRYFNVTFPAQVTATQFNGPLNGNASTATKATQDGDGNTISSTYLKLSGGTVTGNILGDSTATLGSTSNPFHQLVLGGATTATMTAASTNPRITFCDSNTGAQPVHLIYTDYDSYRNPAGLKIIGDSSASSSPAWLEVEGTVYAPTFSGNATSATKFNSNRTVALTGDTTGSVSGDGSSGWSISTTTTKMANLGRIASPDIQINDTQLSKMTYALASSSMTTNKPPVGDGYILTFGWDNGGWASQIAISHTKTPHMVIRGAAHNTINNVGNRSDWGNWIYLLDANNYTDYTVTKTGTGASGTWEISISGTASKANYLNLISNNEIRFGTKPSQAVPIDVGYRWSDGTSEALINRYEFYNGNGALTGVVAKGIWANGSNSSADGGVCLYGNGTSAGQIKQYGIAARGTSDSGKHGYVQGDFGVYTYCTASSNVVNRGWVWNYSHSTRSNVASLSGEGHMVLNGSITVGGNADNTSGCRLVFDSTLNCLNFTFAA